jgi:hypothetical protein
MTSGVYAHKVQDEAERFWSKVNKKSDDECWEWLGVHNEKGYGMFPVRLDKGYYRSKKAHRVAWRLTYGDIPKGEGYHGTCVLHHCDNPNCVNPKHLFLGTNQTNMADKAAKGRSNGVLNNSNILTPEQVRNARTRYFIGHETQDGIAKSYGVTRGCIQNIIRGRTWRWLE